MLRATWSGKPARQLCLQFIHRTGQPVQDLLADGSGVAEACHARDRIPVPRQDLGKFPVRVLASHGHRQPRFLPGDLVRSTADDGPGRQHIVERCQPIAAATLQEDRKVLGMAVGGGQHPEQHLSLYEGVLVGGRLAAAVQHAQDVAHARAAIGFVFARTGDAECLAENPPAAAWRSSAGHCPGAAWRGRIAAPPEPCGGRRWAMSQCATGSPNAARMRAQSPSFSDRGLHVGTHVADQAQRQF